MHLPNYIPSCSLPIKQKCRYVLMKSDDAILFNTLCKTFVRVQVFIHCTVRYCSIK